MRVDWGTGEPLLPDGEAAEAAGAAEAADGAEASSTTADEASSGERLPQAALVKRAGSLAAPQKKLKRAWTCTAAPLTGSQRHFINEVEIHPGYYVDWDATPDATLEPLGKACSDYIVRLLTGGALAARTS